MAIAHTLPSQDYDVKAIKEEPVFIDNVQQESQRIDCLVLDGAAAVTDVLSQLANLATLLPAVLLQLNHKHSSLNHEEQSRLASSHVSDHKSLHESTSSEAPIYLRTDVPYHSAVVGLNIDTINRLPAFIDRSIVQFLKLSINDSLTPEAMHLNQQFQQQGKQVLRRKQQNLSQKLKERLGYLGVYYKRDSVNFLRHMEPADKKAFLARLKQDYRGIVLGYFSGDTSLNSKIDAYVNTVFFADVPVAQVVEIHMDLMDDFAKQLQIEGRSEEILLDYRLTLIDLLANLCEMYRRSIPRES